MWTVLVHLQIPNLGVASVVTALGVSVRPVFRYPHLWRYMESRLRSTDIHAPPVQAACVCGVRHDLGVNRERLSAERLGVSTEPEDAASGGEAGAALVVVGEGALDRGPENRSVTRLPDVGQLVDDDVVE